MKCPEVKQLMYAYLEGQLSSQVEHVFNAHLSLCHACRHELELAQKTNRLLESFCTELEPPPDFVDLVMNRITAYETEAKEIRQTETKVIPLPAGKPAKQNIFSRVQAGGAKVTRVASYFVLVAATSAFLLFNTIPKLPKIASNPGNTDNPPVVETLPADNTGLPGNTGNGGVSQPGQNDEHSPVNTDPEEGSSGQPDANLEGQDQQPPTGSDGDPGKDGNSTPEKNSGNTNPAEGQEGIPEEEGPPPPSLDGPIKAASAVVTASTQSENLTPLAVDSGYTNIRPEWTTGGKEVMYLSTKEADPGNYSLWSYDLVAGTSKIVARNAAENLAPLKLQTKSPDGKRNLYQAEGQLVAANAEKEDPVALTPKLEAESMSYAWSPDGKTVAINIKSKNSAERGLWLAEADGSTWKQYTGIGGGSVVSWSPDGTKIAYTDSQNIIYVLLLDKNESKPTLLPVVPEGDSQGAMTLAWSPNSKQLLFDWAKPGTGQRGIYLTAISE